MFILIVLPRIFRNWIKRLNLASEKTLLRFEADPLRYAKGLTNAVLGTYRFRIGDYRVVFDLEGDEIVLLRVGHRRDIYKG
ncbi:MAG: type II toxin-antitoxin system RelE/ParE family toxin [Desulfuromonadales bacterium]|nr:type II toxin-antitoxin system RelE/ParE family toxin [Desulfuromonadales bacterium]